MQLIGAIACLFELMQIDCTMIICIILDLYYYIFAAYPAGFWYSSS